MSTHTKTGIELIAEERERQVSVEGWTEMHDDAYRKDELPCAAIAYVRHQTMIDDVADSEQLWPWHLGWFKPGDKVRNLVKAGALIAAEIDRLQREALRRAGEEVQS